MTGLETVRQTVFEVSKSNKGLDKWAWLTDGWGHSSGGNSNGGQNTSTGIEPLVDLSPLLPRPHFTDQIITKKGTENHRLYRIGYVPIRYHVKVKAEAHPFLPEYDKYFSDRTIWREGLAKECKQITTFMSGKFSINSRVTFIRPGNFYRD